MTHTDTETPIETDEAHVARVFSPADGWRIVRQVLARLAARFGAHDAFARRRDVPADTARALLAWLRPAELLARKLLFVMACALERTPLKSIAPRPHGARAPADASQAGASRYDAPHAWRTHLAIAIASPHVRGATPSRGWRYRAPIERDAEYEMVGRYQEAELKAARQAERGLRVVTADQFTPRADHDAEARDAVRDAWRPLEAVDGFAIARRIEALLRLVAEPAPRALKLAQRLWRASHDGRRKLVSTLVRAHDRFDAGLCQAGLALIDTLAGAAARAALDTS